MLGQGSADSGQLPDSAREDELEHSWRLTYSCVAAFWCHSGIAER